MKQNGHYISENQNLTLCTSVPQNAKNIPKKHQICATFDVNQLTASLTRKISSRSPILDDILQSFLDRVTQQRILKDKLFDHQLVYCARKIPKNKKRWS